MEEGYDTSDGLLAEGWEKITNVLSWLSLDNLYTAFYIRYSYAYIIVNIKTGLKMVIMNSKEVFLEMNTFDVAERWSNEQENRQLNLNNIERCYTKWMLLKFSNIDVHVKVMLDRRAAQPCS